MIMKEDGRASFLVEETQKMNRNQRIIEQAGHQRFARVHMLDHPEEEQQQSVGQSQEMDADNGIAQHPYLTTQRFDGISPNDNPEPPLNSTARTEFDNKRREQELQLQARLGLDLAPRTAPELKPY